MDMLSGDEIAEAGLTDWRKLAQGLHARYRVDDFGAGARFVVAVGEAGDALGHHPSVALGRGYVDCESAGIPFPRIDRCFASSPPTGSPVVSSRPSAA